MIGEWLQEQRRLIDGALDLLLPADSTKPEVLHQAMRYSVMAGGKRIRPILLLAAAEAVEAGLPSSAEKPIERSSILQAACALEVLHTYSLIHDDLPALDNDDLRRGQPTCHKKFGEANAIMAGDALLTLSFQLLSQLSDMGVPSARVTQAISRFAEAVGHSGMIAGQVFDLENTGKPCDIEHLQRIHRLKTGQLLAVSVEMGAILCGAPGPVCRTLFSFGEQLGLLFQIVDDLLDVTGDAATLGKTPGKDQEQGKTTFPSLLGIEETRRQAALTEVNAQTLLQGVPFPLPRLSHLATHLLSRTT